MMYTKTEAGRAEIQQRSRKLPTPMRSLLLMVDGQRSEADLQELAGSLRAPDDALAQLLEMGLIEVGAEEVPATPAPIEDTVVTSGTVAQSREYLALYSLLTEAIRKHLGLRAYFLQMKVERCDDFAALQAVLPDVAAALANAKSDALGKRLLEDARLLTASEATA